MKRHAYCIIVHNNPDQLNILVDLIDDERNDIYIHVDKDVDIQQFTPPTHHHSCRAARLSDIRFIENRISVKWGDISLVKCELNLLEAVVKSGREYERIHLISGVDLPIKTQDQIHSFFSNHACDEFVSVDDDDFNRKLLAENTMYPYFFSEYVAGKTWFARIIGRKLYSLSLKTVKALSVKRKFDIQLRKGSNWASITPGCTRWLVENRRMIKRTLRYTWCGDELLMATFVELSPYGENISPLGNMRAIDWTRGTPYEWTDNDFDELMESDAMFARKFSIVRHPGVIYKIAEKIKNAVY